MRKILILIISLLMISTAIYGYQPNQVFMNEVFAEVKQLAPESIQLSTVNNKEDTIYIEGIAQNANNISKFMHVLTRNKYTKIDLEYMKVIDGQYTFAMNFIKI